MNVPQVPIEDLSLEAFQSVLNVNLVGPFLFTREAVRTFKAQSPQGGQRDFITLLTVQLTPLLSRSDHQQRLPLCTRPATAVRALYLLEACHLGANESDGFGWASVQHHLHTN